jgi:hypothetical protein
VHHVVEDHQPSFLVPARLGIEAEVGVQYVWPGKVPDRAILVDLDLVRSRNNISVNHTEVRGFGAIDRQRGGGRTQQQDKSAEKTFVQSRPYLRYAITRLHGQLIIPCEVLFSDGILIFRYEI